MIGELTKNLAAQRGLLLDETACGRFESFYRLLTQANAQFNLTRIEGENDVAQKHFLDSLAPLFLSTVAPGARCMDVGAGAGFPSIPLAIARTDLCFTLLDSVGKKVNFLNETARALGLDRVEALHGRAEDFAHQREFRGTYDAVFARAVAPLNVLCELTLPFLAVGGALYAYKGPGGEEELMFAKKATHVLGGAAQAQVHAYTLDAGQYARTLIVLRKIRQTPLNYPRKAGTPQKSPIVG